jgi:predicted SnoaL-like aldol condensation-catalyzing enzyme
MSKSIQEKNKALVLEAFDTLFNQRNYIAAERYWSPEYIQHSAHIAPGREGLFNLIKSIPPTLKYEPGTIVETKNPYPALSVEFCNLSRGTGRIWLTSL